MLGPVNRLMAGYGITDPTGDWTARLLANQGGHPNIDLGMAAQPPVDPGYAMPATSLPKTCPRCRVRKVRWLASGERDARHGPDRSALPGVATDDATIWCDPVTW